MNLLSTQDVNVARFYDFLIGPNLTVFEFTEKDAFNIASEASYVFILSGQKLTKNAQNGQFWRVFEKLTFVVKQCYQTGQFQ